jgi:hypothetical protein
MSAVKPTRRSIALASLLQVASGSDRAAFHKARRDFEKHHGGITKPRDGAAYSEFKRHHLRFSLTYEHVRVRHNNKIREALELFSDRRRAASRHDPPPEPPA